MDASTASARRAAAARVCNGLIAVVIVVSLIIQLVVLLRGGGDADAGGSTAAVDDGTRLVRLFSYFTIESNLIVLVAAVGLALRAERDGRLWRVVRLDGLLGIVITGLVFAIVLAPQVHLTGAGLVANIGFHYIAPWATLLVWLGFGPRPRITGRTVGWALAWPLAWIAYTFAHGAVTKWYPYPFLDAAAEGYPRALVATASVVVLALVLFAVFVLLDRRLPPSRLPAGIETGR